jgi:enoyl-CoA hydratase
MAVMQFETILCDRMVDGVAVITLNRPKFGNGVVPEMVRDLLDCLTGLEQDFSVRSVVLTGAGRTFCAGADLNALQDYVVNHIGKEEEPFNSRVLLPLSPRIVSSRLPIIAAMNGAATAGGLDLAMACDIRIAARSVKMGETYVRLGLASGNGGFYFLPRLVGSGLAAELALTGDMITAERAAEIGLVNRVVDDEKLMDEAMALASTIASRPRRAVEATKQALRTSWQTDLAAVMSTAYWTTLALQQTADVREGIAAAIERREPIYNRKPE